MRIVGHGIDIVEIARVSRMVQEHGPRFLERCFTAAEQAYAAEHARQAERLAGRFAAKEAILKALGTGWRDGIAWTDAEVIRLPTGQPQVRLHHLCRQLADALGITDWSLSISHTHQHAVASAIAMSR